MCAKGDNLVQKGKFMNKLEDLELLVRLGHLLFIWSELENCFKRFEEESDISNFM